MPVNLQPPQALLPIAGASVGVTAAGIRKAGRDDDVVLFELAQGSEAAAVFTTNAFAAAPVLLARERLAAGGCRGLLINSGNANAGTGKAGLADARALCDAAGAALDASGESIWPFSTGVIGQPLPVERMRAGIGSAVADLRADGWLAAAGAIRTTDTLPKGLSQQIDVGVERVTVTGIAKGAGMIRPDMATMLAFIGTDAAILQADLQAALEQAVAASFHCITVDGDTSTNDACVLFATGQGPRLAPASAEWEQFQACLTQLCVTLAQAIVRDAEGATRFVTIAVDGAVDSGEARRVAYTVAESPLVKTALFAGDPNWGRILAAVGRAGVPALKIGGVCISLDDVPIVRGGEPVAGYQESAAAAVMAQTEYTIAINLGRGQARTQVWTCDLGYEYVRINAEYRS